MDVDPDSDLIKDCDNRLFLRVESVTGSGWSIEVDVEYVDLLLVGKRSEMRGFAIAVVSNHVSCVFQRKGRGGYG